MIKERDRPGPSGASSGSADDDRDLGRDLGRDFGRDFGRDGVSGLVSADRAMRARDVSRPGAAEEELALQVVDSLIARANGRAPQRIG